MKQLNQYWLWVCDICGAEGLAEATTLTERDRPEGWVSQITKRGEVVDYCQDCFEKSAQRAKSKPAAGGSKRSGRKVRANSRR